MSQKRASAMSIAELKELILWAKSEKVQALQVGDVRVEFSNLAMVEGLPEFSTSQATDLSVPPSSDRLPSGNAQSDEDDDILYHSALR